MADEGARVMARYVRPIYDAIDARQYKAAIKLCAHKRVAQLDIVLVLKAHCLERTGRVDEALDICRRLQRKQPTDETLLSTMNLVFKLSGCEHEMLPTFEHACAVASPPNEELFQSLFVAYARRGDFLKQQQTALKMYKAFGNSKYVCWAALSMMLQVEHGSTPVRMLALAEKMLLKALRDAGTRDGEALQLTVLMMQLQNKHVDALQAFDEFAESDLDSEKQKAEEENKARKRGDASLKGRAAEGEGVYDEDIELGPMQAIDRLSLEATLAEKVENWTRCAAATRELLEKHNADDWTFLKQYIAARFQEQPSCSTTELLALGEELTSFLTELESRPGNERNRGPALAIIHVNSEILQRLQADKASTEQLTQTEGKLQELLAGYMARFFSKTCCFSDLKQFLALYLRDSSVVSKAAKTTLVSHVCKLSDDSTCVSETSEKDDAARKEARDRLSRRLLALKTLRFLGYYMDADKFSVADLERLVTELEAEYEATSWLNGGSTGGQREVQPTDDLLLLAVHFLLDVCQRTNSQRQYLERAAALLEYGLEKSAYNFQMKLLLSRVYGYLGAAEAMLSRHAELDVKYVQLDSLSFLVLDKLLNLCQVPEARALTASISRLHRTTANDTPEYIARAYRLGVYSKVVDMTSFLHKRMQKSHTLAISKGEALQLELLDALALGPSKLHDLVGSAAFQESVTTLDNLLASDGAQLSRNQHREVVVHWTPEPQIPTGDMFSQDGAALVECDRSADVVSSVQWLKLRALVPKLLSSLSQADVETSTILVKDHDELLTQLKLMPTVNATDAALHQQLWRWSSQAVAVSTSLVAALHDQSAETSADLDGAVSQLQSDFEAIVEKLCAALVSTDSTSSETALSPYGLSVLSTLLLDGGLSAVSALALAQRAMAKKKGKKSEAVAAAANALRSLLKHMQEAFASLETHVAALSFPAVEKSADAASPRELARCKARNNVLQSYRALQSRLSEMLHERSASVRAILQK